MTIQLKVARQALSDLEAVALQLHKERLRRLPALGLSLPQTQVIRILGEYAPMSLVALNTLLTTETPPSRLVTGLVDDRFVIRKRVDDKQGDRREVTLTLTAKGRRAYAAIQKSETALARWLAKQLSKRAAQGLGATHRALMPTT